MANEFKKRKPITCWLKKNKGVPLSFVAEQSEKTIGEKVSQIAVYNFTKGVVRNPVVEKLFLAFGVPQEIIDETFIKEDDK